MELSDEQKNALLRLRKACAEAQEALDVLLKGDTGQVPPPPDSPAPGKVSGDESTSDGEISTFSGLAQFRKAALEMGVDPSELRFAEIAPERFPKLPEEKQRRLIGDCLRFINRILWKYHFLLSNTLRQEGKTCLSTLVTEMNLEHEAVEVAPGKDTPAIKAFTQAARTLAKGKPGGWTGTLEELMKLWDKLAHADEEQELLLLRYAVNTVQATQPNAGIPVVEFLGSKGIREIPAQTGALFNESYSPGKYERRRIRSGKPRDSILQVHQRGFLGPDGVPLQRAIVSVSDGQG